MKTAQNKPNMNSNTASTKASLVDHYRWLRQYGLNDSHSGNASCRDGDTIWVTPTGCCADTLHAEHLVACTLDGHCQANTSQANASLDAPLHVRVYQLNTETACVLHSHGPYTLAMTMQGEDFYPIDFEGQYYFDVIPVLNIAFDDYLAQSPEQVARTLVKYPICVVRGHGVYAQAKTINLAYKWTCTLEHIAKVAYLTQQAKT